MKKIKKYLIVNFICVLLLIISKSIQTLIFNSNSQIDREVSTYLGLFLSIPAFIISIITFVMIVVKYFTQKEEYDIKKFYLLIPFLLMIAFLVYLGVNIFFKSIEDMVPS